MIFPYMFLVGRVEGIFHVKSYHSAEVSVLHETCENQFMAFPLFREMASTDVC